MDARKDHTLGIGAVGAPFIFEDNQSQYKNNRQGQMLKTRAARQSASAHTPDVRLQDVEHSTLAQIFRVSFRVLRDGEHAN